MKMDLLFASAVAKELVAPQGCKISCWHPKLFRQASWTKRHPPPTSRPRSFRHIRPIYALGNQLLSKRRRQLSLDPLNARHTSRRTFDVYPKENVDFIEIGNSRKRNGGDGMRVFNITKENRGKTEFVFKTIVAEPLVNVHR